MAHVIINGPKSGDGLVTGSTFKTPKHGYWTK